MARIVSFFWRVLTALALVFLLVGGAAPAGAVDLAVISAEDEALLFTHLQILAQESNTDSSNIVTHILGKPHYTSADWTDFFGLYFLLYPFTDKLFEYLTWPTFWATPEDVRMNLRTGITPVLKARVLAITAQHGANLGPALAADAGQRATLGNALRWMMYAALHGNIDAYERQDLFEFTIRYVEDWPQFWKKQAIDTSTQPVIAALTAQIHANLREFISRSGDRQRVLNALGLQGRYLDLWVSFSLLIYDNNGLDAKQLDYLYKYYNDLPRGLRFTRGISVADFLGNQPPHQVMLHLPGVNIFGLPIGAIQENGFPPDVEPRNCDVFAIVVAHETNHSINAHYIDHHPMLKYQHDNLIYNASREPLNYLRSMSEEGFFVQNPQEFFAAIANQYHCSSEHTFRLGLERYRQGRPHPLDQALFFANVYSLGSDQTYFYSTDLQGKITRRAVPFYQDGWGFATGIQLADGPLYVWRDPQNIIAAIGPEPPVISVDPASGMSVSLPPDSQTVQTLRIHNSGELNAKVYFSHSTLAPGVGTATFRQYSALRVPSSFWLNMEEQMTIEAWVNPTSWEDGNYNNGRILQKGEEDSQYLLTVGEGGKDFVFDLAEVGKVLVPNWKPPLNTWTHVAATYDGAYMRIYVNGQLRAEKAASGKIRPNSDALYIGNKDYYLNDSFIGQMDEVRLWSIARTADEIDIYRSRTLNQSEHGLVGYWKFDTYFVDGYVPDRSGFNNNAEPVGPVTVDFAPDRNWAYLQGEHWEETLQPGQTTERDIRFSSEHIPPGTYSTMVVVLSNDPQNPSIRVPLHMTVSQPQPVESDQTLYLPMIAR